MSKRRHRGLGGTAGVGTVAMLWSLLAVTPAGAGYLTVHPLDGPRPLASDLNYAPGEIRPNLVIVKVGADGRVGIFSSSTTDLVVDVAGYFLAGELAGDRVG